MSRYELPLDGDVAFINYRRVGRVVTMTHAEVPDRYAGRGVGSALVKGALDLLRVEAGQVVPSCPFVATYIKRHAEYRDLLVPGA